MKVADHCFILVQGQNILTAFVDNAGFGVAHHFTPSHVLQLTESI